MIMNEELELLKQKTITLMMSARFNQNHGKDGRFTSGGGGSGGSGGSYTKADGGTQLAHQKAIAKLNGSDYEDGTYNLDTLTQVSYSDGYQVTFCQIGDDYSNSEYADRVNEFLAVSTDGVSSAGKFGGTPEVSFHVADRATAERLGRKYNQISIWDWENCAEISTGGTGERKNGT